MSHNSLKERISLVFAILIFIMTTSLIGNHCQNHHRRQNVDRITAQKFADVYGIDKIKQIIANCPQNCDVYRECVGDTIIRQIPIGVFQTVLVTLGHDPNPQKEITND